MRFELTRLIGTGGAGSVWLAEDRERSDLAAVKVMHAEDASIDEARRRFRSEGEIMRGLDHPAVLTLRATGEHDDLPWLATDFMPRGSLGGLLLDQPMEEGELLEVALQVLDGLSYLHGLGIVHRDVKADNVLLDGHGCAVLSDFGIAKAPQSHHTIATDVLGTPGMMAPEQMLDPSSVTASADVFGVGSMLFTCLTRAAGQLLWIEKARPAALAHVPDRLRDVIDRSTRFDPAERIGSANELADELADLVG